MFKEIIPQKTLKGLVLIILGIFLVSSLVSAFVLYRNLNVPLSPHYGAAISIVTKVKESLIIKTVEINLTFCFLTVIGFIVVGIFYSHRIAGPLVKVKQYASMLGEGRFDERISFRRNDVVHRLSSTLNDMAEGCQNRTTLIASRLEELEEGLLMLSSLSDESKEKIELVKKLREIIT
jgi:signal transduction histidine kinase